MTHGLFSPSFALPMHEHPDASVWESAPFLHFLMHMACGGKGSICPKRPLCFQVVNYQSPSQVVSGIGIGMLIFGTIGIQDLGFQLAVHVRPATLFAVVSR